MIEFNGKISGESLKYAERKFRNTKLAFSLPFLAAFIALLVINLDNVGLIVFNALFVALISVAVFFPSKKGVGYFLLEKIVISGDYIEAKGAGRGSRQNLSQIKEVIDFGEGYHIKFKQNISLVTCICQKDLITQGRIENFEGILSTKIIRKQAKSGKSKAEKIAEAAETPKSANGAEADNNEKDEKDE